MDRPLPWWQPLSLFALAGLTLFLFLGSRGLNEPDEGRYAEIGREMVATGDWLTPHLNGVPHFQKPPVVYWATASSLALFGINNWAARLPSALAAWGMFALTYWIGSTLFRPKVGVVAALVLLTSLEFFAMGRLLTPDMTMAFWITAAVACLVKYGQQNDLQAGQGRRWSWLFFVAMGIGFLTKGPMAFVVPISAAVCWQWARRKAGTPISLPWFRGILLMLLIGLSWFLVLSFKSPALREYFIGDELVKRFASKKHGRSKPFWFFFWVLPVGLMPWTFFFGAMLLDGIRKFWQGVRPTPPQALLIGWVLIPFLVLSASGSKLPTYVLPLFPSLALAIGAWSRTEQNRRSWNVAFLITFLVLTAIGVGIPIFGQIRDFPAPDTRWLWPPLLLALAWFRLRPAMARLALGLGAGLLWLSAANELTTDNDFLEQQASVEPLARKLLSASDFERSTIFACESRAHGWEFYLQRLTVMTRDDMDVVLPLTPEQEARMIENAGKCEKAMLAAAPAYGLVRSQRFKKSFAQEKWAILEDAGDFLLIGTRDTVLAKQH